MAAVRIWEVGSREGLGQPRRRLIAFFGEGVLRCIGHICFLAALEKRFRCNWDPMEENKEDESGIGGTR